MKFLSRITATILSAMMFLLTLVGCGTVPFEWKQTPPETVRIGEELVFRDYLNEEENATYALFVSYENPVTGEKVENKKQSSLIYTLSLATVYNFTVERTLKNKTATLQATVEALPKAPAFTKAATVYAEVGETKTFEDIFNLCGSFVTPAELQSQVKFEKVDIEKIAFSATDESGAMTETQTIAENATEYTFAYGGVYTFYASATNKSGTAQIKITATTVDEAKVNNKVNLSFDAKNKILSWEAVENATGYRLEFGTTKLNLTETSYSFADATNGEYEVSVAPIYGDEIYTQSFVTRLISVGVITTPLTLTVNNYTVAWQERGFVESYTVTENGTAYTLPATQLSYTLQGVYATHDEVNLQVVANFDYEGEKSSSQPATATITYGTVFLKAIDGTKTANTWKEVDGIEFVEVSSGLSGNTWVMAEFKGKNAPNFAIRAEKGFNSLAYDKANSYWSPAGLMLMNSQIGEKTDKLYISRGFFACTQYEGGIDVRGYLAPVVGDENAPGMKYLHDDEYYIMIIGYEHDSENLAKVTAIFYTVDEYGELTEVYHDSTIATSAWKYFNGNKVIAYPNVSSNENSEGVTFTYYPASETLAGLVNGSTSKYKEQMKALLSV